MGNGLPTQDELQRRLRAARALQGVTLAELAARIDPDERLSERTLRKLEAGDAEITRRYLRPIAKALHIPIRWFTDDDPLAPLRGGASPAEAEDFERRLAALEARIAGVTGLSPGGPQATQRGRASDSQSDPVPTVGR